MVKYPKIPPAAATNQPDQGNLARIPPALLRIYKKKYVIYLSRSHIAGKIFPLVLIYRILSSCSAKRPRSVSFWEIAWICKIP